MVGIVHALSNNKLNFMTQIIARGIVVLTQDMPLNGDETAATLSFTATSKMAPKARLVVYALRPTNNEILVDAVDFKCDGLFRNNARLYMVNTVFLLINAQL
jgi:hypothetical protein